MPTVRTGRRRSYPRDLGFYGRRVPDSRELRIALLEEIRRGIAFDAYVWVTTDPRSSVGASPLADVPCLHELPRAIGLSYRNPVNRWTVMARNGEPVSTLQRATGGDLAQSLFWRELQRDYGVVDVLAAVFSDRFGCWGFLQLWRIDPSPGFSTEEEARLSSAVDRITADLRGAEARTFATPPPAARSGSGPMVLLLGNDLAVRSQTDATGEWLATLLPPSDGGRTIPAAAYNVGAQLLAVEAGVDDNPASARVHLADGMWVTLRAARLDDDSIAVTLEETTTADRLDLFCRCFALSQREAELLGHLATGGSTREVAERMYVSEHTVQDHLKSVFAKTSARDRRSLLSRVMGTR